MPRPRTIDRDAAVAAYIETGTLRAAAARLGCSPSAIKAIVHAAGVPRQSPNGRPRGEDRRASADAAEHEWIYGAGARVAAVRRAAGLDHRQLARLARVDVRILAAGEDAAVPFERAELWQIAAACEVTIDALIPD